MAYPTTLPPVLRDLVEDAFARSGTVVRPRRISREEFRELKPGTVFTAVFDSVSRMESAYVTGRWIRKNEHLPIFTRTDKAQCTLRVARLTDEDLARVPPHELRQAHIVVPQPVVTPAP